MNDPDYSELKERQDKLGAKVDDLENEVTGVKIQVDGLKAQIENCQASVTSGFANVGREVSQLGASVNQVLAEKGEWGKWLRQKLPYFGWAIFSLVLIGYGVNNLPDIIHAISVFFNK